MLETTLDAHTNAGKHFTSNIACVSVKQTVDLLIGPNDIVLYDFMLIPAFCQTKRLLSNQT